jgi:tRNA modification GTPase
MGVQKTMEKISQSALLVYVYDASVITIAELNQDIESLQKPGVVLMAVANKIDLLNDEEIAALPHSQNDVTVSAKEKFHIDDLKHKIYHAAVKDQLNDDQTLVTNIRHLEALQKTEDALSRVLAGMETVTSDFLSMDIKQALHYLGEITGVVTTDDLLENIFSKFCIGK